MNCTIRRWKSMERWDCVACGDLMSAANPVTAARIGSLLSARREPVGPSVSFRDLTPITIHFDGSISRRELARDRSYTMAMLRAEKGDVVLSKIDLKNGAVGVLDQDWPNVAVTTHFAVYRTQHDRLAPAYFRLLVQTPRFKAWLASNKSGHDGRTEVKLVDFENLEIPLPDLATQKRLSAAYDAAVAEAARLETEAGEAEQAARRAFEEALGLSAPPPPPKRFAAISRFRTLERWSHEGMLQQANAQPVPGRFPLMRLGDVIADLENGWSPQCESRPAAPGEWGVLKLGAVSFGTYDERQSKALPANLTPRPEYEVKPGDVLISRGNALQLVAAAVHVVATRGRLTLPDLIFRVVWAHDSTVRASYLAAVLQTPYLRAQIEAAATGTSPSMKKVTKPALFSLRLPLPPLAAQQDLVAALHAETGRACELRNRAAGIRKTAWQAFVEAVFSPEPRGDSA